jgi:type II secretory pathway pseudopilin PulG
VRRSSSGFTLVEIMVAFAILSLTLVSLLGIVTTNVRATNHAKMTTAATFLARTKMSDVEDYILYQGFTSDTEKAAGTFKEDGYPQFRWETLTERIELPTDLTQRTQDKARDKSNDSKDPMSLMTGFLGGVMSSFIEPIRIGLQESVRKVTVRVLWDETGRRDQTIEVVQYLTDPSRLDAAMQLPGTTTGPGAPNTTTGPKPPPTGNLLQGGPQGPFKLGGKPF